MPNHIHIILTISDNENLRAIRESPLQRHSVLSKAIGCIKATASKEIHRIYGDDVIWQRGFYDHIIRCREDYAEIAKYIEENPIRWQDDSLYSE